MPLHTIEPKRLYRQIADQLRTLIEGGEFTPHTRLPAERELAAQLGVSRPSVREALIALEVEGLVEVRMGSGIYVRERRPAGAPGRVTAEAPLETIRAREVIESELAARAAATMKPRQLRGLREAITLMEQDSAGGTLPTRGDRLFHVRIAECCDNAVLLRVVTELYDERHNPLFAQLGSHFEDIHSWGMAIQEHRAVADAIAAHAPDEAREAMRRHLVNSHYRFTASWRQPKARRPPAVRATAG
jgi:GntR family transcriptional repressor for pyruvate dehydrogenase complex